MKLARANTNKLFEKRENYMDIAGYDKKANIASYSKRILVLGQKTLQKFSQTEINEKLDLMENESGEADPFERKSDCKSEKAFYDLERVCKEVSSTDSNQDGEFKQVFKSSSNIETFKSSSDIDNDLSPEYAINTLSPYITFDNIDLTSIEMQSPIPVFSYSPIYESQNAYSFQIRKLINETLESEEGYINSLKLLLNFYIESSISKRREDIWQPLKLISFYLKSILNQHSNLLVRLKKICLHTRDMMKLSIEFSKTISEQAVDVYLYSHYCSIYDDIVLCLNNSVAIDEGNVMISRIWYRGWEIFLEATQPILRNRDLSFVSLLQGPIARIGKYKIILSTLSKYVNGENQKSARKYLEKVKDNLTKINDLSKELNCNIHYTINELLDFNNMNHDVKVSSQFFGKPLLIGSLFGVWVETNTYRSKILGCFLYKSHLILCDFRNKLHRTEILFIIPLCSSKITKGKEVDDSGLTSKYSETMKLTFEKNYGHYEILIVALSTEEFRIWYDHLSILINFVNGPSELNFSSISGTQLAYFPQLLQPCCVRKDCEYQSYEGKRIEIRIILDFIRTSNDINKEESSYNPQDQDNMIIQAMIIRSERVIAETDLKEIWSKELPLVVTSNSVNLLTKSKSWSLIRIGSLRSIKKSSSFSGSFTSRKNIENGIFTTNNTISIRSTDPIYNVPSNRDYDVVRSTSKSLRLKSVMRGFFQNSRSELPS